MSSWLRSQRTLGSSRWQALHDSGQNMVIQPGFFRHSEPPRAMAWHWSYLSLQGLPSWELREEGEGGKEPLGQRLLPVLIEGRALPGESAGHS